MPARGAGDAGAPHARTNHRPRPEPPDQAFAFHRSTDPELWRTTVPLIVRLRCGRHKGLISTWLAIHWLTVLYSAREDAAFGVREIAEEAGVGRNELAGPSGHIQRLLALELIQIVGYRAIKRGLRPCPVYHIDLPNLERQSIAAIQELLRTRGLPTPPRPAPDPRQLALFDEHAADVTPASAGPIGGRASLSPAAPARHGTLPSPPHATGTEHPSIERQPARGTDVPGNGTADCPVSVQGHGHTPENGTVAETPLQTLHGNGTALHGNGTVAPAIGPVLGTPPTPAHPIVTVAAPDRDIERQRERQTEGEHAHAHDSLVALATAAARTAMLELLQQLPPHTVGLTVTPPPPIPAAPRGETPLPAPVLDLWAADRPAVLQRDRFQLEQLAASADHDTGGHGAYWLGRAILMAETCLEPRGQRPSVAYLRTLLRRWQREGSWGSDLAEHEEGAPAPPARTTPAAPPARATPPAPACAEDDHPAVLAYRAAFGRAPNGVQAEQIVGTVSDLAAWRQVLTDWQANGWKGGAVANMLDRYRKGAGAPADSGPPVSVTVIHRYPGLSDEQRDRWIARFHAAATPAEKRAVLARLEQEHPR